MAKSAKFIQDEILAKYINQIGAEGTGFEQFTELPITEQMIIAYAANFIKKVQENLRKLDKIDTGTLEKDVSQGELIKSGGKYELDVGYPANSQAAKYYDFVNKGVKGFISGTPDSPYSFKNAKPSMNGPMVTAIQKWIKRQGITSRKETKSTTISSIQRKRKSISELNKGRETAWLVARSIKRKGLPKTGYFDSAVAEYFEGPEFAAAMAKAVGGDVRVYIRQANELINKENK